MTRYTLSTPLNASTLRGWWEFISLALAGDELSERPPYGVIPATGFYLYRENGRDILAYHSGEAWDQPRWAHWDVTGDSPDAHVTVRQIRKWIAGAFLRSKEVHYDAELKRELHYGLEDGSLGYGIWETSAARFFQPRTDGSWDPAYDNFKNWIAHVRAHRGQWAAEKLIIGGSQTRSGIYGAPASETVAALDTPGKRAIARRTVGHLVAGGYISPETPAVRNLLAALDAADNADEEGRSAALLTCCDR